jgi:hypothetical protein
MTVSVRLRTYLNDPPIRRVAYHVQIRNLKQKETIQTHEIGRVVKFVKRTVRPPGSVGARGIKRHGTNEPSTDSTMMLA